MAGGLKRLIGRFAAALGHRDEDDGELLERFVASRDESAFAALLVRHGPMVYGVCRRVLGHEADAEDAFQATFLVLARKAATVRPPGRVGNWLHGVARRTALEARRAAARRRAKEARAVPRDEGPSEGPCDGLDEELARLPPAYREVIVLCDLEGRGRKEVAAVLGCAEGTVASRLARARRLLAKRLGRAGLPAAPALPAALADATAEAVATGAVPARAQALAEEVIRTMFANRLTKAALLLLVGLLAVGVRLASAQRAAPKNDDKAAAPKAADKEKAGGDLAKLAGTWFAAKGSNPIWVIEGGKLAEHDKGPEKRGLPREIEIDPDARPRTIYLSYAKDHLYHGIYEVEGDTLRVCLVPVRQPRPTKFDHTTVVYNPRTGRNEDVGHLRVFRRQSVKGGFTVARDVVKAFQENEARADARFTDRQVTVIATVQRVRRHGAGYALWTGVAGDTPLLFAFGIEEREQLAKFDPGDIVVVQGRCKGREKPDPNQEVIAFTGCKIVARQE